MLSRRAVAKLEQREYDRQEAIADAALSMVFPEFENPRGVSRNDDDNHQYISDDHHDDGANGDDEKYLKKVSLPAGSKDLK